MPTIASLIATLLITAVVSSQASTNWTVYLRRVGPLHIGMSLSKVRQVLHDPRATLAWTDKEPDDSECAYLQSSQIPKTLGFMFQKAILVRIDVSKPGIRTASGVEVGDTEDKVKRLYPGRITVKPHHYSPESGHYLTYIPVDAIDSNYRMLFETENSRVTMFRIGTPAAVSLVEGCS